MHTCTRLSGQIDLCEQDLRTTTTAYLPPICESRELISNGGSLAYVLETLPYTSSSCIILTTNFATTLLVMKKSAISHMAACQMSLICTRPDRVRFMDDVAV